MHMVSLRTASELTGLSKRTLWRRIAAGRLFKLNRDEPLARTSVALESIIADIGIPPSDEDLALIQRADGGDPEAQADVALLLMEAGLAGKAVYWLRSAADQGYADAMHWLGRCYVSGEGVDRDEAEGLAWIGRAAAAGHSIAGAQMQRLSQRR